MKHINRKDYIRQIDEMLLDDSMKTYHGVLVSEEALRDISILLKEQPKPERKTGEWYRLTGLMPSEYAGRYRCSECDGFAMHDWQSHKEVLTNYCPWCGADMRGEKL